MNPSAASSGERASIRRNAYLYAGVIIVEVIVLVAIWLFQRYFGT